jgi:alpha-aminoadipic semialdehyde synthase
LPTVIRNATLFGRRTLMKPVIGIRRETKSIWERRAPLTPTMVRHLVKEKEIDVLVQPCARRVYSDADFVRAGATLTADLSPASVVFGVKEIPPDKLLPDMTYVFFSHVIKGQPQNMPMLARLLELGCTLIDYEKVQDGDGRRLIFFGRFAGLAGMIDTLWALGQRLSWEGIRSPLTEIQQAHTYDSLDDAKAAVRAAGDAISSRGLPGEIAPLVIGIAGYGNVASGAREILHELPTQEIAPEELSRIATGKEPSNRVIYEVTFKEEHLVTPRDPGQSFELQDYYQHPEGYRSCFAPHLEHLSALVNCNYWDARYPRLLTVEETARLWADPRAPRLRVIGDLGCDIDGSIQCTRRVTEPSEPVYVYEPASDTTVNGVAGRGPVVLAVDILPSELPRDASEVFSEALGRFVPGIARADYGLPFESLELPPEIRPATIVHRGRLTPDYRYLEAHLQGA